MRRRQDAASLGLCAFMADHRDVYIVSAVRTPIGCFQGALKSQTAVDLGVAAAKAAIERANIQPTDIQEALIGCVLQAQLGQSPARQVALRAGCPPSTCLLYTSDAADEL